MGTRAPYRPHPEHVDRVHDAHDAPEEVRAPSPMPKMENNFRVRRLPQAGQAGGLPRSAERNSFSNCPPQARHSNS